MTRPAPLPPPALPSAARRPARAGFSLIEVSLALIVAAGGLLAVFGIFPVSLRQSQLSRSDMIESGFASTLLQTFAGNIRLIDDISDWNDPARFWELASAGSGLPTQISDENNGSKHVRALLEQARNGAWTGRIEMKPKDLAGFSGKLDLSPKMTSVASGYGNRANDEENIWYVAAERNDNKGQGGPDKLIQPAQFLVRLACVRRPAMRVTGVRRGGGGDLDNAGLPTQRIEVDDTASHDYRPVGGGSSDAWLPNVYILSVISTDRGFPDVFLREPVFSQEFTFVHRP